MFQTRMRLSLYKSSRSAKSIRFTVICTSMVLQVDTYLSIILQFMAITSSAFRSGTALLVIFF